MPYNKDVRERHEHVNEYSVSTVVRYTAALNNVACWSAFGGSSVRRIAVTHATLRAESNDHVAVWGPLSALYFSVQKVRKVAY